MTPRFRALRGATGLAVAGALLLSALPAHAQCAIEGPTTLCGGSAQLCAPSGDWLYEWTAPNGTMLDTQCIAASQPGTWRLHLFDYNNGLWFGPCYTTLTGGGAAPVAVIDGVGRACSGSGAALCGSPEGMRYAWSGPGGFASAERCVNAGASGDYSLVVTDPASGCASEPATASVVIEPCGGGTSVNCPRPPVFWARPCSDDSRSTARVETQQLADIAACVDDRAQIFDWSSDLASFCATLKPRHHELTVRARAKRQFAAVWANVCAHDLGIVPARGAAVGLDAATTVHLGSVTTTVGAWLADADAQLLALESKPLHRGATKEAYRQVIRAGWWINHGYGMGATCGRSGNGHAAGTPGSEQESLASDDDFAGDLTLAEELVDQGDLELSLELVGPNPTPSGSSVAFTLAGGADQDVTIAVYDLTGRRVKLLANGRYGPGRWVLDWDGRDESGQAVRNGVYFVLGRLDGNRVESRLTVLR